MPARAACLLALLVVACDSGELAELERQNVELTRQTAELTAKVDDLGAQLEALRAELRDARPKPGTGGEWTLRVYPDGRLEDEGTPIALADVCARAKRYPAAWLVIAGEPDVRHAQVVAVLDEARKCHLPVQWKNIPPEPPKSEPPKPEPPEPKKPRKGFFGR